MTDPAPFNPRFIRVASDLHLEWRERSRDPDTLLPPDERDEESVLALAGDIGSFRLSAELIKGVLDRFPAILYVPGNHEYYGTRGHDLVNIEAYKRFSEFPDKVMYAFGDVRRRDFPNVEFIFGTLWTDCDKLNPISVLDAKRYLADFRAIPGWSPEIMAEVRDKQKATIESELRLADPKRRKIIVTHHLPSYELIHPQFKDSLINGCFASDCTDLMFAPKDVCPDVWIFGHTHCKTQKMINNTLCIANPLGYPLEVSEFTPNFFIDLQTDPTPRVV